MYHNLVISGGSWKCFSVLGCAQYLIEHGLYENIKTFVGTSAGAIVCFLLCIYDHDMISTLQEDVINYMQELNDNHNLDVDNLLHFFDESGIETGEAFTNLFKKFLKNKFNLEDINFLNFAKATGKDLVICVSNLTKMTQEYCCVDKTPTMSVITALRMSMSIPFVFTPVSYEGSLYVDGALYNDFPIDYIDNRTLKNTIAFHIGSITPSASSSSNHDDTSVVERSASSSGQVNIVDFTSLLFKNMMHSICKKDESELKHCIVVELNIESEHPFDFDISSLKFDINAEKLQTYIRTGYSTARERLLSPPLTLT